MPLGRRNFQKKMGGPLVRRGNGTEEMMGGCCSPKGRERVTLEEARRRENGGEGGKRLGVGGRVLFDGRRDKGGWWGNQ